MATLMQAPEATIDGRRFEFEANSTDRSHLHILMLRIMEGKRA